MAKVWERSSTTIFGRREAHLVRRGPRCGPRRPAELAKQEANGLKVLNTWIASAIGPSTVGSNETFVVNLSSPTNATITDGQGVGTITDDEPRIRWG